MPTAVVKRGETTPLLRNEASPTHFAAAAEMNGAQRPLLNDSEAATVLGLSPATLRSWRCRGIGPAFVKMGRGTRAAVRYHHDDLNRFIDQARREPALAGA
jgi:hypothetical protein